VAFSVKDRLVAGGLAGIIAGLIQYVYGLIVLKLGLTDRIFGQYSDVLFSNRVYTGFLGAIMSILTHLAVTLITGVLFAYIIEKTSSRYYLLKGAGYGFVLWFLLSSFGTIYKMPLFTDIPAQSALVVLVGAIIYGIALAYILKIMDRKSSLL
jgi:hypothetical protein